MKIETDNSQKTVKGGEFQTAPVAINPENTGLIAHFLRDKIYSEKEWAVLREYAANAVDEHRTHNIKRKALIELKKIGTEWNLVIRDYAHGLDYEGITKIFGCYLSSTKSGNNKAIGGFGVGSKSGHAYAHAFFVTSWHKSERSEYMFSKGSSSEDSEAEIITLSSGIKDSEPSGISVRVPVQEIHVRKFRELMRILKGFSDKLIEFRDCGSTLTGEPKITRRGSSYIVLSEAQHQYVLCGIVPYKMDKPFIEECLDAACTNVGIKNSRELRNAIGSTKFVPVVPIGSVSVALSRETIDKTAKTKAVIVKSCEEIFREVKRDIEAQAKSITNITQLWNFEKNKDRKFLDYVISNVVSSVLSSNPAVKAQYEALKSSRGAGSKSPLQIIALESDQNGSMTFNNISLGYGYHQNRLGQDMINAISDESPVKKVKVKVIRQECLDINGYGEKIHQISKQGFIRAKVSEELKKSDFFGSDSNENLLCLIWTGKASEYTDKCKAIKDLEDAFSGESWLEIEIINNPSTDNKVTINRFNKEFLGYDFEQVKRRSMMEITFDTATDTHTCHTVKDEDVDLKNGIHAFCSGVTEGGEGDFAPKKLDINSSVDKDLEDRFSCGEIYNTLEYYRVRGISHNKKIYFSFKAKKELAAKLESFADFFEEIGKKNSKKISEDFAASEHSSVYSLEEHAKVSCVSKLMNKALGRTNAMFTNNYVYGAPTIILKPNLAKIYKEVDALDLERSVIESSSNTVKVQVYMPHMVTKHKIDKEVAKIVEKNLKDVKKKLDKLHEKLIILSRSNDNFKQLMMFVIAEDNNFSNYRFWSDNNDKFGAVAIPQQSRRRTVFSAAFELLNN